MRRAHRRFRDRELDSPRAWKESPLHREPVTSPAELRRIPLFSALSPRRFELLARTANVIDVPAETTLIREGETGREFFAIADGEVEIASGGEAITKQAGEIFGDYALLYGVPRTATVKTTTPSRLVVLDAAAFRSVLALGS